MSADIVFNPRGLFAPIYREVITKRKVSMLKNLVTREVNGMDVVENVEGETFNTMEGEMTMKVDESNAINAG